MCTQTIMTLYLLHLYLHTCELCLLSCTLWHVQDAALHAFFFLSMCEQVFVCMPISSAGKKTLWKPLLSSAAIYRSASSTDIQMSCQCSAVCLWHSAAHTTAKGGKLQQQGNAKAAHWVVLLLAMFVHIRQARKINFLKKETGEARLNFFIS